MSDILTSILAFVPSILLLTVVIDVVVMCVKIYKMNQLMSIVKKGEISYRQFLNKMDKMVDEF